jgi:glycosyltransferase involved in cell wall biosynthesis
VVSRLVSYKRIDIAVEACSRLGLNLVVIGEGPDRARLESLAGPSVRFLGRLSDAEVIRYMQRCRALLFPGLEDFGITPLEANACGRPVIAYHGGGALDTIRPGVNGQYFPEQHADSLARVLEKWDDQEWDSIRIRKHAERFNVDRFLREIQHIAEAINWTDDLSEVQAVES